MRFAFIFINRCALATAHGPRPDVRHTPGQRRARHRQHAGGPAHQARHPRHLLYAALAEPASLVLWSGETKDQLFLFLDRAGRARRTPVRGR